MDDNDNTHAVLDIEADTDALMQDIDNMIKYDEDYDDEETGILDRI